MNIKQKFWIKNVQKNYLKFIQFVQNSQLNKRKLDTIFDNKLRFGCPWTMNDSTEFKMPSN